MMTLQHLHLKYNSLVLVQENIERVKILGVVTGESRRGLGVVYKYLSTIITLRDNSPFYNSPFSHTRFHIHFSTITLMIMIRSLGCTL